MRVKYCNTVLLGSLFGCGGGDQPGLAADRREEIPGGPGAASNAPLVLVVGTSLTAGYGLDPDDAWPAALERRLRAAGYPHRVIAAGVSGETSAGALRRIDWLLERYQPAVFILETGGNDGLRGLRPDSLQANLVAILRRAAALSPPPTLVLLAMEAPPNYGRPYTEAFRMAYRQAAEATGAVLVPFFLEGVAGVDSLNLSDGIHPRPEGHELAADNVWRVMRSVLGERVGG